MIAHISKVPFSLLDTLASQLKDSHPKELIQDYMLTLLLKSDGKEGKMVSSSIQFIDLDLNPYGYKAKVHFITYGEDEINQLFASEKVMDATLTFQSADPEKMGTTLIELKGIVNKRAYKSIGKGELDETIRLYEIEFMDAAQASWSSHFPMNIFVDQTMKDVIDSEKNPLISIKYDWDALNEVHPILAFALEYKGDLPASEQVSFYSFLMWYLQQAGGILEYNYKEDSYTISGKKSEEGKPVDVAEWCITPAVCTFHEPIRHNECLIKHSPDKIDEQNKNHPTAFQAVRKDTFDDTSYPQFPEQIIQLTQSKLSQEKPEVSFQIRELTDPFNLDQLIPGTLINFKGDKKLGGTWSEDSSFKNQTFRLKHVAITAHKTTVSDGTNKLIQPYQLNIYISAEDKAETYIPRPPFKPPSYPFSILGKIFSDIGDKEQTTFNVVKNDKAPLGQYQVLIPLAGSDKKVVVPFTPDFISGQHYFPLCKDQEVLLSMYFQTAKLERVIDWQPLTRLPPDVQGCQIMFASNGKDKYVYQKHEFKDGKDSILTIQQSTSSDQTQTIQIQEKDITITVQEKDKSTILIQWNRDSGLILRLKDETAGVTQETVYNPTAITHTSEGSGGKSTIVQKPDSIAIECKNYTLTCDEAVIDAKKTVTAKAQNKAFIQAPVVNIKDNVKLG